MEEGEGGGKDEEEAEAREGEIHKRKLRETRRKGKEMMMSFVSLALASSFSLVSEVGLHRRLRRS